LWDEARVLEELYTSKKALQPNTKRIFFEQNTIGQDELIISRNHDTIILILGCLINLDKQATVNSLRNLGLWMA
jgi:hypothetical protein